MKYFTTDVDDGWIHMRCEADSTIDKLVQCNKSEPTIFIVPSGNSHGVIHPKFFAVPYSSHSNYYELQAFVKAIMPYKLSFIVPYKVKDTITQKGPEIFLRSYVRQRISVKEESKVLSHIDLNSQEVPKTKYIKQKRYANTPFKHKAKRIKSTKDHTTKPNITLN